MATRSIIAVIVNPMDLGKVITPDPVLLGKGICTELTHPTFETTTLEKDVLSIYHHWDGYPNGVGATLLTEFNSYEKALNLMSFGDASSINGVDATFYNSWRENEPWERTKPSQYECESDFEKHFKDDVFIEYLYLFKDGEWFVKENYTDEDTDWEKVSDVLSKPEIS